VAFKLAWALATEFSPRRRMSEEFRDFLFEATGLVALGTVCDVVPLQEENRVLVSYGLRSLVDSPNPGLRALLEVAGLANRTLEPLHLGFKIGPRINAAGRMGFPGDALSLLTSSSYQEAIDFATRLDTLNTRRQNQERSILTQVLQTLEEKSHPVGGSVVIAQRGWSPGIMGIVAARLVDIHRAPAVLISMTETNARGSGRSIPGFNLLDVLKECQSYLTDFGGHASAVGFTLELDQVEAFVHDFHKLLREKLAGFFPESGYAIDHQVDLQDLSQDLIRELDQLKPYGECNPPPLFLTRNVKIAGHPRPVGKKKKFLKFLVNQSGNTSPVSAIGPMGTMTPENLKALSPCDILHIPHRVFRGGQEVLELRVKAIVKSGSRD